MKRHNGFTLVELLVVIAIIGLLLAMLLPSLTKARDASVTADCLSRQHQIGIIIAYYQSDNQDFFPACHTYSTDGTYGNFFVGANTGPTFRKGIWWYIPNNMNAFTYSYGPNKTPRTDLLMDPGSDYRYISPVNVSANVWPYLYAGNGDVIGYEMAMQFGGGNVDSWTTAAQKEQYFAKNYIRKRYSIAMMGEIAANSPYWAYTSMAYTMYNHKEGTATNVLMSDYSAKTYFENLQIAVNNKRLMLW